MHQTMTPTEAWRRAAERAHTDHIEILRDEAGGWHATSGRDPQRTYELDVAGNVARGCTCMAGALEREACKHRAAFYVATGAIPAPPEADPALAPFVAEARAAGVAEPDLAGFARYLQDLATRCPECGGGGILYSRYCEGTGWPYPTCHVCGGTGRCNTNSH